MPELAPERLADIKGRCEAAPPGPWRHFICGNDEYVVAANDFTVIDWGDYSIQDNGKTLDFVLHSVEDVLDLLAEVTRQEAVINWLAQACANGGMGVIRRDAEYWRQEAERAVGG